MRGKIVTNAKKYLKEGVSVEEFANKLGNFIGQYPKTFTTYEADILKFLNADTKPTLTEDEIAILRNIPKNWKYIIRVCGELHLAEIEDGIHNENADMQEFNIYNHLFQFIKERRRILY